MKKTVLFFALILLINLSFSQTNSEEYKDYVFDQMAKIDEIESDEGDFTVIVQDEEFVKVTYYLFGAYGIVIKELKMEEDLDWLPDYTLFFKNNELLLYEDVYEIYSKTYFIEDGKIITTNSDVPEDVFEVRTLSEIKKDIIIFQKKYKHYSKKF